MLNKTNSLLICLFIALASGLAYAQPYALPAPMGLVSWWSGDNNALDARNRNNGALQNGATFTNNGQSGAAFSFDGVDDFVIVSSNSTLNITNKLTIEAWVYPTSNTSGTPDVVQIIANKELLTAPGVGTIQYEIGRKNSQACGSGAGIPTGNFMVAFDGLDFGGGNCDGWIDGGANLPLNTWSHVAATFDGVTLITYVNGIFRSVLDSDSGSLTTTTGDLRIGGRSFARGFWAGRIDELSIYNRDLTDQEILKIYNAGTAGKSKPTATVRPTGLVSWWPGDGGINDLGPGNNVFSEFTGLHSVGKVGQGHRFDGIDDYVRIGAAPELNSADFTFEFWVKPTRHAAFQQVIAGKNDIAWNWGFYQASNNNLTQSFFVFTDNINGIQTPNVTLNQWHHLAVAVDTNGTRLYLNGVLVGSHLPVNNGPLDIWLGRRGDTPIDTAFQGDLDEVSYYDRGLTDAEIASIANADVAGKLKSIDVPVFSPAFAIIGDQFTRFPTSNGGRLDFIPLSTSNLPAIPGAFTGLIFDISTSVFFTGAARQCFILNAFNDPAQFANLHVLHLENNVWVNRTSSRDFSFRHVCSETTSFSPFAITQFGPTAANVSIGGRVVDSFGRGLARTRVTLTDRNGNSRTALTGSFGYYSFDDLEASETYILEASSKRLRFADNPRVLTAMESVSNVDFFTQNSQKRIMSP